MKRRYSVLKFIIFMFLFMIPVCFSDWVYLNKTASVAAANTDEVTVTIHTRAQSSNVTVEGPTPSTKTEDTSLGTRTFTEDYVSHYDVGDPLDKEIYLGSKSSLNNEKTVESIVSYYKQEMIKEKQHKKWTKTYIYI